MDEPQTEAPETCPLACPNRRRDGVTLNFDGKLLHLDPLELLLYFVLALPIGIMVREAFQPDYSFDKAAARTGAIVALVWAIRKAPTESAYEWLESKKIK